jgi:ATP-dependent Lon protease
LPIGGLKEKLLAAARGGIKTVLIPEDNAKDLTEISDAIKGGMDIIPVARLDDVVFKALVRPPVPIVWEEDSAASKVPAVVTPEAGDEAAGGLTAH